jgi:rfaE bifunctional protein kinase chain/domain
MIKKKIKNKPSPKIGLCQGVFDVVHIGHIKHFISAKKICDYLVVSITLNKFIKKGKNRPIFSTSQRYSFLKSIKYIDEVYICSSESAKDAIEKFKPNYYFKGPDYKDNKSDKTKKIYLEKKLVEKYNGKVIYTKDKKYSSSSILHYKLNSYNKEQLNFINNLKNKFSYIKIINELKKLKKAKVCVLGELILDIYNYGDVIGKSGKEPHLVLSKLNQEIYMGGTAAIANNIATITNNIELLSELGMEKKNIALIKKKIHSNVKTHFYKPYKDFSTITKHRYIDKVNNYKLLGYYNLPISKNNQNKKKLYSAITRCINKNNVLVVADYGHNFFDKKIIDLISNSKINFKSANIQLNSSNFMFQDFKKFKYFDAIFVNEGELKFQLRDAKLSLEQLAINFKKKIKAKNLIITRGKNGALCINSSNNFFSIPAFALSSVDKVGAGDSLFSIATVAMGVGLDIELSVFLGSLAASISVQYPGNKYSADWDKINKTIKEIYH